MLVDALDDDGGGRDGEGRGDGRSANDRAQDARSRELIHDALGRRLTLAAVLRLARSPRAGHRELVEACLDGRVALADATSDVLARRLHRAKLRTIEAKPDPTRRLRLEGFSPAAAEELLALREPKLDPVIVSLVRAGLADWLTWVTKLAAPPAPVKLVVDAATLVVDAAVGGSLTEHLDALMSLAERVPICLLYTSRCV